MTKPGWIAGAVIGLSLLSACSGKGGSAPGGTSTSANSSSSSAAPAPASASSAVVIDKKKFAKTSTVCSPLAPGQVSIAPTLAYTYGLAGRIYSLNAGQTLPNNLAELFSRSTDQGVNLFLHDLNVPTRLFTEGFPAADGHFLKDDNGNELLEYFGIDMYSSIQLAPTDAEGSYQLALLADDGATLDIMSGAALNQYTNLINDDGMHMTHMACATEGLQLSRYQQIPIHLKYMQGPRYHIALMLMWRPVPKGGQSTNDVLCGTEGNSQFFDPNNNSAPEQNYTDLLSRGWVPLAPQNYVIPQQQAFNPCAVPDYWSAY